VHYTFHQWIVCRLFATAGEHHICSDKHRNSFQSSGSGTCNATVHTTKLVHLPLMSTLLLFTVPNVAGHPRSTTILLFNDPLLCVHQGHSHRRLQYITTTVSVASFHTQILKKFPRETLELPAWTKTVAHISSYFGLSWFYHATHHLHIAAYTMAHCLFVKLVNCVEMAQPLIK